jgi:hypothetical protein
VTSPARGLAHTGLPWFPLIPPGAGCSRFAGSEAGSLTDIGRAQHVVTVAPDGVPLDPTTYEALGRDRPREVRVGGLRRTGPATHGGFSTAPFWTPAFRPIPQERP